MRDTKFRGISTKINQWVYGDLVHNAFNGTSKNIDTGIVIKGCYPFEVITETVGQFTGLLDKNGKEIYEGDKIKVLNTTTKRHIDNILVVIFENGAFCLSVTNDTTIENESNSTSFHRAMFESINYTCKEMQLEVIGSIHDKE